MIKYIRDPITPHPCSVKDVVTGTSKMKMYPLGIMWYSFRATIHLTRRIKVFL